MHRQSLAAGGQTHPCASNMSLWCVLRSSDVALNLVSFFVDKKDCVGLRTASRAFAACMAAVSSVLVRPKVVVLEDVVEVFNPGSKTWGVFPSTQQDRVGAASAVISGRLYVCGGVSERQRSSSRLMDCFDPLLGIWQILPPMSQGRMCHAAAVNGARLYVCGGRSFRALKTAECFDTLTISWKSLPSMAHARDDAAAAVIRHHVYVVGGDSQAKFSERLLPTGSWQVLPEMTHARETGFGTMGIGFAIAVVTDKLYVCGGRGLTSVERFDPEVGAWELLQRRPERRCGAAVAVLHGQLYMCGGMNDRVCLSSVERFDPTHNRWETLAPMTHARSESHVVVVDGQLFICGGRGAHGPYLDSAEWFDPLTGRWEALPDMTVGRMCSHVVMG